MFTTALLNASSQEFLILLNCGLAEKNKTTAITTVVKIKYSKVPWPILLIFLKVIINPTNKKNQTTVSAA